MSTLFALMSKRSFIQSKPIFTGIKGRDKSFIDFTNSLFIFFTMFGDTGGQRGLNNTGRIF